MAKVPHDIETLPKISIAWVGCTNVTDRQTTDGRPMTYSEYELEFTFDKKLQRTHQSPLALSAAVNYIQGGDANVPCTARLCATILGVVIHTDMPVRLIALHKCQYLNLKYNDCHLCACAVKKLAKNSRSGDVDHHHHHRWIFSVPVPITWRTYVHYRVIKVYGLKTNRWKMLC